MRSCRAFSLVEVVIAVAIFAGAVAVTIAMLPALTRQSIEASDALVAQRMPDSIQIELKRIASEGGFDALASPSITPMMATPLPAGLTLVATRNGVRLHSLTYQVPPASAAIPQAEQYFLIELWQYRSGALTYDANGAVLPLYARVSWPYRTPAAAEPMPIEDRNQLTFAVSIRR
jgi:prepilin-type N-terminal cleavage/methylation domain-containing protein